MLRCGDLATAATVMAPASPRRLRSAAPPTPAATAAAHADEPGDHRDARAGSCDRAGGCRRGRHGRGARFRGRCTPISSLGVSASMIAPVLTNILVAVGDEGVELVRLDQEDLHAARPQAGRGLEDRAGIVLDQRLGLGVAGDADAVGKRRPAGRRSADCRQRGRWRPRATLSKPGAGLLRDGFRSATDPRSPCPSRASSAVSRNPAPTGHASMPATDWRRIWAAARRAGAREPMSRRFAQPSRRSAVEPFLAMDVMRAAIDREHAGASVIHMEVGQPGAPAPTPVLEAARRRLPTAGFGYTEALGIRRLRAAHRPPLWRDATASTSRPSGSRSPPAPRPGFNLAFLAAFDRWRPHRARRAGLSRLPQHPRGARPRGRRYRDDGDARHVITPEMLAEAHAKAPLAGRAGCEPGQSERHHDAPGGARRADRARPKRSASASSPTRSIIGLVYAGIAETALAILASGRSSSTPSPSTTA